MMIIGAAPMQPLNAQAAGMNQNTRYLRMTIHTRRIEAAADSSGSEEEPSQSEPTEEAAMPDEITEEANGPEETAEVQNGAEIPAAGTMARSFRPRAAIPFRQSQEQ